MTKKKKTELKEGQKEYLLERISSAEDVQWGICIMSLESSHRIITACEKSELIEVIGMLERVKQDLCNRLESLS